MRIDRVQAVPLFAPFARMWGSEAAVPTSILRPASHFRHIPRTGQHATIVIVEADGLVGLGEAFGLPDARITAGLINSVCAPALVGRTLTTPADVVVELVTYLDSMGQTRGFASEALSGIDIALWDLLAKANGRPLAEHLGGSLAPVPLYASPVPFLDEPAQSAAHAGAFVREGFRGVKLKVGRGIDTDLAHTRAVREAVGTEVEVMLDANCAYGVRDAIALANALDDLQIAWLEEPIRPDDPAGLAEVRAGSPLPIAAGENEFRYEEFAALVEARAVDVLQPNIARAGGVTGLMAIGSLCASSGVAMAPHGVGSGIAVAAALHVCCVAEAVRFYEANRLPNPLRDELPVETPRLVDGAFTPADRPGHGCTFDWPLAQSYAQGTGPHQMTDAPLRAAAG